jgi:hypothetical protein
MLNTFQAILSLIIRSFLTVTTASVTEAVIAVKKFLMMSDSIAQNMLSN